jgi:hypothetical protein
MLLGRRQWPHQHIRASEEDEPLIFLAVVATVCKKWSRWAKGRLRQLHSRNHRRGVVDRENCYITALQRFQVLIKMQIPGGRPPQNSRSETTFRIHNFWTQFVYPRFITVQAAFYIWRTTTRAAKANREMQMHLLEIAAPN